MKNARAMETTRQYEHHPRPTNHELKQSRRNDLFPNRSAGNRSLRLDQTLTAAAGSTIVIAARHRATATGDQP
jgi:hypothetical protein